MRNQRYNQKAEVYIVVRISFQSVIFTCSVEMALDVRMHSLLVRHHKSRYQCVQHITGPITVRVNHAFKSPTAQVQISDIALLFCDDWYLLLKRILQQETCTLQLHTEKRLQSACCSLR